MPWKKPEPICVVHLFPELLDRLLQFLSSLSADQWGADTGCTGWSVKDVALHLLGDEIGILSRKRDRFVPDLPSVPANEDLVATVRELNEAWVTATRRMSPRLLCELLSLLGEQSCTFFRSLDPESLGGPVSWAGPEPAPVWLDLAREYTERWHHQQHIRDAVGRPGLKEPRYLAPVLDTFARALPHTFRRVQAREGTIVTLLISGTAGGAWSVERRGRGWVLWQGKPSHAEAEVEIPQEVAWRLFTRGIGPVEALGKVSFTGSQPLGRVVLDMVSIIA